MISVCISTYNGEKYIYRQLETIYHQSLAADEVVICDDCSLDATVSIIEQFIEKHQLKDIWHLYRNESNRGYPGNFYYAMSLCRGDIVFLADQDDVWKPDKLKNMVKIMEDNAQIGLLASKWGIIDHEGKVLKEISRGKLTEAFQCDKITIPDILYCYDYPGMAMCYRKVLGDKVLERIQGGRQESKLAHDVALCLMAAEKDEFYAVNQVHQYHRRHNANVAMEEHRVHKLLNKKRKICEIDKYIDWLQEVLGSQCLETEEAYAFIKRKKVIMQERLDNLINGKRIKMLRQYWKYPKEIRLVTVICDWLICGMR